jgi:rhomboid protease GluP
MLAQQNSMVYGHALWQLFTSIFVTDSYLDAAFNAVAVFVLDFFLPDTFNNTRYFGIFFSTALLGNIFTLSLGPSYASAGASGGIFGLFAAAFAYSWAESKRVEFSSLGLFLILFVSSSFFFTNVNWFAHLGGSIGGFIAGPLLYSSIKLDEGGFYALGRSRNSTQLIMLFLILFMVLGSIAQFLLFISQ